MKRTGCLLVATLCFVAFVTGASHAQLAEREIDEQLVGASTTEPWVDVIVALREPATATRAPLDLTELRQDVAVTQDRVLSALTDADFELVGRFEAIPALFGRASAGGLQKLAQQPDVVSVHANEEVHATLAESVPLINADDVHVKGFTGEGVVAAVLDTGIDTDHLDLEDDIRAEHCYLGNTACPGGGHERHGPGSAEDGDGHGTHVSGIITGRGWIAPTGVAPDAGIVAFKVLDDSGRGTFYDVLRALDYIINHPGDGIRIVNMSLGGDSEPSPCDTSWPELASAINTLRKAGVATFAASGNDAAKNAMGAPACISSAISVGAVYDANVGAVAWASCTDLTTASDKVACFSNSSTELDLLAPGAMITSSVKGGGTATWGGTSMASPHAAGVAALMLDADPSLEPTTIESRLKSTGVPITDPANGVTTPRVDALRAIQPNGLCGDVDCDGDVDAVDAMFIVQHEVGLRPCSDQCPPPFGTLYCLACNRADCDTDCDVVDALFVLQHVVGLRPNICACS